MAHIASTNSSPTGNPYLDSLIWGGKWVADSSDPGGPSGPPQVTYYFASGPDPTAPKFVTKDWSDAQKDAFSSVLQLYSNIINVDFLQVSDPNQADDVERLTVGADPNLNGALGTHDVPDPDDPYFHFAVPLNGYYNIQEPSFANPTPGNYAYMIFIHEFGHALGLAHPHDGGSDGQVFPGVHPGRYWNLGTFELNQGIWTVMSYNAGWNHAPPAYPSYGYEATPMAFDVAALQQLYGANTTYQHGDNLYSLPTVNAPGTFWSCIWDTGGTDEISAAGAKGACSINLNDAPLSGPNAGGYVSWMTGIRGGFTIANGVVIENATGGDGNDTLVGNDAANILTGGAGNDSLDGGAGNDDMRGGLGNDTYIVDSTGDKCTDVPDGGIDIVKSSVTFTLADPNIENLTLTGSAAIDGTGNALANMIVGNAADNHLDGKGGADTMVGGLGNDSYVVDAPGDVVTEAVNAGNDTVTSQIDYVLGVNLEDLVLTGTAVFGTGNAAANHITGDDANNVLDGKAGADTMAGGKGDDTYFIDNPGDVVTENPGEGTADTVQTTVNLAHFDFVENYTYIGTKAQSFVDTDPGDHKITTGSGADSLGSGGGNDVLNGGAGADTMAGGAGDDTYVVDNAKDTIIDTTGHNVVDSSVTYILVSGLEDLQLMGAAAINATGDADDNHLYGNAAANILDGKAGADTMEGGLGNDTYFVDNLGDKVIDTGGIDIVNSTVTFDLTGLGIENLTLLNSGAPNVDATGNELANRLTGNDGDNVLDGKGGADTMAGGKGNDTYFVDNPKDVVTEAAGAGTDTVRSEINYTLAATLENLVLIGAALIGTGNAADNVITGDGGDNTLDGRAGADTMAGGDGNDVYFVDNIKDVVTENPGEGTADEVRTTVDLKHFDNVENYTYIGTKAQNFVDIDSGDHKITTGSGADSLGGGGGNDILNGGAGADTMSGGAGNDTYVVDNAKDVVIDSDGKGTIQSTISIDLNLPAYGGIDNVQLLGMAAINATGNGDPNLLTGNPGANKLSGGDGNDTLSGDLGNDTLDGGKGADSMQGGMGNDTFVVDNAGDVVADAGGIDTVLSSVTYTIVDPNVENLTLTKGAGDIDGTGNSAANVITGNEGANHLDGLGGADTMIGGLGNDTYFVDNAGDKVTEAAGGGTDTVHSTAAAYTLTANVEALVLDPGGIAGTGNTLNNTLTGNAGDNTLDGGTGADSMIGGAGNDTYIVDNAGDTITEAAGGGGGNDTIKASISIDLANPNYANVENVTLTGAGALSATGDAGANHLVGNSGANTLTGGDGNDTLDGGLGNDVLIGGKGDDQIDVSLGNDTVKYITPLDGHDVITGFDANPTGGQDVLNLDALFDSLGVATAARAALVEIHPTAPGTVDVNVNADSSNPDFELHVATLNLTSVADTVTVGQDVIVGTA